jgi:hypothetical protein
MPTLEITSEELIVRLSFWERLASLQREIRIPLSEVRGATDDEGFRQSGYGFRSPGTNIPGVLSAGTYRRSGERQFVYVTNKTHPVVIELSNKKWSRIILGVTNARAEAARINTAISGVTPPIQSK